jgi:hypothetical protein
LRSFSTSRLTRGESTVDLAYRLELRFRVVASRAKQLQRRAPVAGENMIDGAAAFRDVGAARCATVSRSTTNLAPDVRRHGESERLASLARALERRRPMRLAPAAPYGRGGTAGE